MSCKSYVKVTINLIINKDENISTNEIMSELEYVIADTTGKADVVETEIVDYEIIDEK